MATAKLTVPILIDWKSIESYMEQHDIVEVVRCRDCKCWETPGYCIDLLTQDADGFCKWAERREDAEVH